MLQLLTTAALGMVDLTRHQCAPARAPQPWGGLSRRAVLPGFVATALPQWSSASTPAAAIWLSGKSDPLRPTSKEKADGTKKDSKYLGCLNDCVPRCQGSFKADQQGEGRWNEEGLEVP